jgi:type IV secretion/conjugal transfer VirB4 family ATPase
MYRLEQLSKHYQAAGVLHSHVNLFGFWDEETFITKSGDPGLVLRLGGIDYESLDHAARDHAVKRLEAALRSMDERTRVYQILSKSNRPKLARSAYPNPLVQSAMDQRMAHLISRSDQLFHLAIYYVLIRESSQQKAGMLAMLQRTPQDILGTIREIAARFASDRTTILAAEQIESDVRLLKQRATSFRQQLEDLTTLELLPSAEAFKVLYQLLNLRPESRENAILIAAHGLDYQLCDTQIEAHRGHLRLDDQYVKVLTMKEAPSETWPLMLRDLLEVRANFTVVMEWKPLDNGKARKLIQSRRRHFHNSKTSFLSNLSVNDHKGPADELVDDSKQAAIADLGQCLTAIGHEGKYFGEVSLSIVAYANSQHALDKTIPEFIRVFTKHDGALLEERYNLLNAFFATVPGNWSFNLRRLYLLNTNLADLSFLFTVNTGEPTNRHLGSEYLAVLETDQATPYYLNLHNQDVAHTLILGATGSGKSFLLNFLIQNLQKYDPQTYIFDLGNSFENITRIFGGSYLSVGPEGQSFTINPFNLAPTKANLNFLYAFLKVLIEGNGKHELSGVDERSLYTAIERSYKLEAQTRTLTNFAAMVGPLKEPLHRWTRAGQFGHVFDNPEDTLTLRPFQTFNFDATSIYPDVLEPLLFYVLHRASSAIENAANSAQFKAFIMDEAWIFIRNRTIRDYVTKAEKTWRKKNAAMILATQSLHELARSEILEIVCESCPTKIFLSNPDIDVPLYRDAFHLNDTELELLAGLAPKREFLLKNPQGAKKLHLSVDSFSYWMATNTPRDNSERQRYFDRYGVHEGLTRLARDHPVESSVF